MLFAAPQIVELARACAPDIAPEAMLALVQTESGGNSLVVHVNGGPRHTAASESEASSFAKKYINAGYSVDIGLAQINSRTLAGMGMSIETAMDACKNLQIASSVLQTDFAIASRKYTGIDAISVTYSLYNTGSERRGFANGYVDRVWKNARAATGKRLASRISTRADEASPVGQPTDQAQLDDASRASQSQRDWVVGQVPQTGVVVF